MSKSGLTDQLIAEYRHLTGSQQLTERSLETIRLLLYRHHRTFSFTTLAANK